MKLCIAIVYFVLLAWAPTHAQAGSQPAGSSQQTGQQQNPPAGSGQAKIDPAKETDIRKLIELSGAQAMAKQTMDSMMQGLKPLMINALPEGEYRDKLVDLFFAKFQSKADPKQLLDKAIPIYDKYFSREEVKGLIQFYQTPLGQKAVTALPKLTAEAAEAGRQWGQQLGRECMQEVLSEHPDLASALEAAGKAKP